MINHFRLFSVWVVRSADTWPSRMRVKNGRFSVQSAHVENITSARKCRMQSHCPGKIVRKENLAMGK